MNKIKFIYDVVKTMKEKDIFKGTLKAEALKDERKILIFENVFERNNLTGQTKAKVHSEVDCEGKKIKTESTIEFEGKDCHGGHGFMKHLHLHHHHGENSGGIKGGLNKLAFILGIFNNMKIEENEDQSVIVSLMMEDVPEEIRKAIHEKMEHGKVHQDKTQGKTNHHLFMKEFHDIKNTDFKISIFLNKDREIQKITLNLKGEQLDEESHQHAMKLDAELCLNW
jgi:hypothetical protein